MKTKPIKVVRLYLSESAKLLKEVMEYLKKDAKIRGVTVFRGISGYGETGEHSLSFLDLSMDLPIVVEFFETEEKAQQAFTYLAKLVKSEHLVMFDAICNI